MIAWPLASGCFVSLAPTSQMVRSGVVSKFLDFFLGDASPLRAADAPQNGELGNRVMQPKYKHLINTVQQLVACLRMPGVETEGGADADLCAPFETDAQIIRSQALYNATMKSGTFVEPLCKVMVYAIRQDREFSQSACKVPCCRHSSARV